MAEQCREVVYRRDTYRRTGRGPTGFELHYRREQCTRKATYEIHCWQHAKRCRQVHMEATDGSRSLST